MSVAATSTPKLSLRSQFRYALINASRALGRLVCRARGAYSCIRCGELSRPLESLPFAPDDDDWDRFDDHDEVERQYRRAARWFSWLPFPRWL